MMLVGKVGSSTGAHNLIGCFRSHVVIVAVRLLDGYEAAFPEHPSFSNRLS